MNDNNPESPATSPSIAAAINAITKPPAVLYIEHDKEDVELMRRYLAPYYCRLDVAMTGHDGVDMAVSDDYALIVADVRMPDMPGSLLYKTIMERYVESKRRCRIMMTSGQWDDKALDMLNDCGVIFFALKDKFASGGVLDSVLSRCGVARNKNNLNPDGGIAKP